ncbi:MAG TPA: DNA-binding domain-containing protein [Phycisphaerae bacterium]|nr:DNA-binding domain-containing protein [Phycisphaerae bacterium]
MMRRESKTLNTKSTKPPPAQRTTKSGEPVRMNLEQTQRLVASLVMRRLTADDEMQRSWVDGRPTAEIAEAVIAPNDRLSSFERIEIYNKQYWFRLRDCFGDDFPGVRAVLGDRKFDAMTEAYLNACPSRSFTLRNLGQFLVGFLETHPELTAPWSELALDMAKFEWAQVQAFDGPGYAPLSAGDLAKISAKGAKARLHLQPYVQLLELRYPLDDFLLALKKKNAAMRGEASNAMEEDEERPKLKGVRRPLRKRVLLAVHRFENSLYYKRLEQEAFDTLVALRDGATLEGALAGAIGKSQAAVRRNRDWLAVIQEWFDIWTRLGWFYSPAAAGQRSKRR